MSNTLNKLLESANQMRGALMDSIDRLISGQISTEQANAVAGLGREFNKSMEQEYREMTERLVLTPEQYLENKERDLCVEHGAVVQISAALVQEFYEHIKNHTPEDGLYTIDELNESWVYAESEWLSQEALTNALR